MSLNSSGCEQPKWILSGIKVNAMGLISRRFIKIKENGVELVKKEDVEHEMSKYLDKAIKHVKENAARLMVINHKRWDSIKLKSDIEIKFE